MKGPLTMTLKTSAVNLEAARRAAELARQRERDADTICELLPTDEEEWAYVKFGFWSSYAHHNLKVKLDRVLRLRQRLRRRDTALWALALWNAALTWLLLTR